MPFHDHLSAGWQLARKLGQYRTTRPLVLGIPRGGVRLADVVAEELQAELDLAFIGRLVTPGRTSYRIGCVSEYGDIHVASDATREHFSDAEVRRLAAREVERLQDARARCTPLLPLPNPSGRTVILVDDVARSGSSLLTGLFALRARKPLRLIVAVAVASHELEPRLSHFADEVVILESPPQQAFVPVDPMPFFESRADASITDREIRDILLRARGRRDRTARPDARL